MSAVVVRMRAELRERLLAWLVVALVVGAGGGVVIGLVAGARRTEHAYPEFLRAQHGADVLLAGKSRFGLVGSVDLDNVRLLRNVVSTSRVTVSVLFTGRTDDGRRLGSVDLFPIAPNDNRVGRSIERWHMLDGRRADPTKIDEATASFVLADRLHLHVGSTVRLHFVRASSFARVSGILLSQFGPRLAGEPGSAATSIDRLADGPDVTFHIVGIEASPLEFPPFGPDLSPALHLTRAFTKAYGSQLVASPLMYVQLRKSSDFKGFAKGVEELAPGQPVGFIVSRPFQTTKVQRTLDVQANALLIAALLTLLALVFIVAQTLTRQAYVDARDDGVLRALGMTRGQIVGLSALRGGVIAVAGALLAAGIAIGLSPLMPLGIARTAELHLGVTVDVSIVAFGVVVTLLLVVGLAVVAALRMTRTRRDATPRPTRPPVVDRVAGRVGMPVGVAVGVRFAFDRRTGSQAVPVWTAVFGVVVATALLAGTWSFRDGLDRLLATPHLYGWNWDVKSGAPALPDLGNVVGPALARDPTVRDLAIGTVSQAQVGPERTDVLAIDQRLGTAAPTVLEGRLPRRPDEAMLGTKTIERAGTHVGGHTIVRVGRAETRVLVVGRGVFPEFGDAGRLGSGVLLTYNGLRQVLPDARRNVFLVRFKPGVDVRAQVARLRAALEPVPSRSSGEPRDLQDLARVQNLPSVLAGILALLAAATLAHTLVTSVRRRRRDLAILKSLGFRRRQIIAAVVAQTTTLVALALAIGLPLGTFVGRAVWRAYANSLGAVADPTTSLTPLLLSIPVALLFGNAIAAVPAWLAGRTRAATVLRTE